MKRYLFKLILFSVVCAASPEYIGAETMCLKTTIATGFKQSIPRVNGEQDALKWEKRVHRSAFHFWGKGKALRLSDKKWVLLLMILLLSFLLFVLVMIFIFGLILSMPMGAAGQPDTWKFPVGMLLFLVPMFFCERAIVGRIKKIVNLNNGGFPPEELPNQPPSKPMNKQ